MTTTEPAIVASGLRRNFGDKEAVRGVDLAIEPGEVYGFLGPNGAGKSTTVRMLCTLSEPTAGQARVLGFDVVRDATEVRLRIGVALQDSSLDPLQTGIELLRLQGRLYGLSPAAIDSRLADLAALVDIGDALGQRIKTYSGGMKRRLDLAAALMHNPDVLFLDEPTSGLDPVSRTRIWDEVQRLNATGITIFLTTQYLEEADALAHRVGIIDRGLIIAEDTPDSLKRQYGSDVIVAELDTESDALPACAALEALPGIDRIERHGKEITVVTGNASAQLSPVAIALSTCRASVANLTMRRPSLDDVYLQLTGAHLELDAEDADAAAETGSR